MDPASYNWENPTKKELWGNVEGGNPWNYQPNGAITQIKISWGSNIDSISFKSTADGDGNWTKFGATTGREEPPFQIGWPNDYVESISGSYDSIAINTLCFKTHKGKQYGPFGTTNGGEKKFEISTKDSIIVGFFGREGALLDALGVYVKPFVDVAPVAIPLPMLREERNIQPVQFLLTVGSFSLMPTKQGEQFHSEYFDFGNFTWKFILYPNGDKNPQGKGYISLYLAIHESTFNRGQNFTVSIDAKFIVLNKFTNKYLTVRDVKGETAMKFSKLAPVQGLSQVLSLDTFKNPSNGYLVDDACSFGAEFLIIDPSAIARQETLTLVKDPEVAIHQPDRVFKDSLGKTFTWNIKNFNAILAANALQEVGFTVRERVWILQMSPKGKLSPKGKFLSLYLVMPDWSRKAYMKGTLRIVNHPRNRFTETEISLWFNPSNKELVIPEFILLSELLSPKNEYIKDDTLLVQIEFDAVSQYKIV
ncbi:hypothetical protein Dsin_003497 [Dipteronia sinensis]|uniref:Uncharacterized protein n=1 Tax=Dipteronia sinensis TaxID=43782 RepID=A0AAE0B874_9ROSI|nr:hypothetical protein Dsin_003497 [Dipteronia sinensis]